MRGLCDGPCPSRSYHDLYDLTCTSLSTAWLGGAEPTNKRTQFMCEQFGVFYLFLFICIYFINKNKLNSALLAHKVRGLCDGPCPPRSYHDLYDLTCTSLYHPMPSTLKSLSHIHLEHMECHCKRTGVKTTSKQSVVPGQ